jgi:hypothetical protein
MDQGKSGPGEEPPEAGPWWDRMQLGTTWTWKRGVVLFVIGGVATLVVHFLGR